MRRKGAIAAGVALGTAALSAGVLAGAHYVADRVGTCMNQGPTVVTKGPDGKCAGITDGSFSFIKSDPVLAGIMAKIRQENQIVTRAGKDYASVAYLLPMAVGGVESVDTITEQLAGAYAEQMYANSHDVDGAGTRPLIQLLIASDGKDGVDWTTAVQHIRQAVTGQHLLAVAGLGVSLDTTTRAIHALAKARIPVVGATITSDDYDHMSGLFRVSPSNQDDVAAILSYVRPMFSTAIAVTDMNPKDSYDKTLVRGFAHTTFAMNATKQYDTNPAPNQSESDALAESGNLLAQIASYICTARGRNVVLFAGRGNQLAELLASLADSCQNQQVTIVTGDDVTNMPATAQVKRAFRHVTLYYAGSASPSEWSTGNCPAIAIGRRAFKTFDHSFREYVPLPPSADASTMIADGIAMMGYDATLTSIAAIRWTGAVHPTTTGVLSELPVLNTVPGSSGPITLTGSASNPVAKAIPILQYQPDATPAFKKLSWSAPGAGETGEASQTRNCR